LIPQHPAWNYMDHAPFVITFAGVVGSSKTPIASYLSWNLGLPVFNNDAVRCEVMEDLLRFDDKEFRARRDERIRAIVRGSTSFICDASMDREWRGLRPLLAERGYRWFIISLDLSEGFLLKLFEVKEYHESAQRLDQLLKEHAAFASAYRDDVSLRITDEEFPQRLAICLRAVREWLNDSHP
jgi:hypothetical protein